MNKILLLSALFIVSANANFNEKVAASFAGKYEVCAVKLKNANGYELKAIFLQAEGDKIYREKEGSSSYLRALKDEKGKAWFLSKKECKKIADRVSKNYNNIR